MIRGNVANLGPGPGATVALGNIVCLENDSPDNTTLGFEDATTPLPGQAFFYLTHGSDGLLVGPGDYGHGSQGGLRVAAGGDCAP